ncbi:MAG: type II toxin-antitoxin system mRNA interferase toxin, RelE/StbE family [Deltaproteobacteria bacterium HGW-Deltaproteobacteria-2]|nr:MAG: type II toxin-antitoxin system mRNA interferase toxin, RelE/StbE family [Deltaproteobacteria bacterium HGW-Deltaproteobacteria-2]
MLNRFEIAETETFQRVISKKDISKIYNKVKTYVYPQLRINPFFGKNIKKLKGEFKDVYRYRIGEYRLFYQVDEKQILIFIMDIMKRKEAY